MSTPLLWHNPRCSKSRQALSLLEEHKVKHDVRLYLEDTPSVQELKALLKQLSLEPRELIRTSESLYKELNLKDASLSDQDLIQAMADHPKLIQRPVLVVGSKARIGRPPEEILELLE